MGRLNLTFKNKLFNIIEKMALRDECSKPEVVRKALAIYNYLCDEVVDGNKVIIVDENDEPTKHIVFSDIE